MGVRFAVEVRRLIVAATTLAEARGRSRPILRDLSDAIVNIGEPVPPILTELLDDDLEEVLTAASNIAGPEELSLAILVRALGELRQGGGEQGAGEGQRRPSGATKAAPPSVTGTRVGIGYDSHRLGPGGPMILGGITFPADVHCIGHSDGDAICHAVTDAVLGAAGAGDIGALFSDSDPANAGRNSAEMLRMAIEIVGALGYTVLNADVTVIAERPKINAHRDAIRAALGAALGVDTSRVSVKGKTNEGMGWIGSGEGIAVIAVATLLHESR